ncbi:hypothetical protein [Desulfosporosinus burensis]
MARRDRWPWTAECPCSQGWREGTAGHGRPSVPVAKTQPRMVEIRAPPWMARCRDDREDTFQKVMLSD